MPDSPRRKTQQLIERAAFVRKTLQAQYPNPPIPLIHHDPFTLCIAVLLSAHTTDKSVNKVTPELFRRAPNPVAMAELGEKAILEIIRPVGLAPTKSRNVHALALKLLREFDGRLPQTLEELESLPGVGHKTASVVMCQAYGQPAFPVDTHIHRLAERWNLSSGRSVEQTETDLKSLFEASEWAKLHLQMIYFGRQHCPARNHHVEKCPICGPLQDGSWRPKKDQGKPAKNL